MGSDSWQAWQKWEKSLKSTLAAAQKVALKEQGYDTQDEALEATEADGTASVLDITDWSDEPQPMACWNVPDDVLEETFGTTTPTQQQVEEGVDALHEELGRGEILCVIAWEKPKQPKGAKPVQAAVLFAGWSCD
jgi:hypothetical protein